MKIFAAICALIALAFVPDKALSRTDQSNEHIVADQMEEAPLIQWDEPELFAQQAPPVVTPPVPTLPAPLEPPKTPPDAEEPVDPAAALEEDMSEDDFSLGDIPVVETIELTPVNARNALTVYVLVREKYKDAALEDFENLQDFVDQAAQGKTFEADIKAAGFANVIEWNTTITTLGFAYENLRDDQTSAIKEQIAEIQNDTEIAEDMRNRMIAALNAMIPSQNNKKIIEDLNVDPAFKDKLPLLETEGE